jgi:hypothetical protein
MADAPGAAEMAQLMKQISGDLTVAGNPIPTDAPQKDETLAQNWLSKLKPKGKAVEPPKVVEIAHEFQQSKFLNQETTRQNFDKLRQKEVTTDPENIGLSRELTDQYESFLKTHVENLCRITNPKVLDNANHREELLLMKILSSDSQPDKAKITNFLNTEKGWQVTTMLLEKQTALKLFAYGLEAAVNPKGVRGVEIKGQEVRMHIEQGTLNHHLKERFGHWLTDRAIKIAGRQPDGLMGRVQNWLFWGGHGAVYGGGAIGSAIAESAVGGAVTAGVAITEAAVVDFLRDGLKIDLKQCANTLKAIKGMSGEKAYMKQVLGIDLDNFNVNAAGQIEARDPGVFEGRNSDIIYNEILQGIFGRFDFYQALGVPQKALDALPEQFLFTQTLNLPEEQTSSVWSQRLNQKFKPNNGGIRDTAGHRIGHAAFNPNALDEVGNLKRHMKARREVMEEMMRDHIIQVQNGVVSANEVTLIDNKILHLDKPEVLTKRKEAASTRKNELEKQRTELKKDDGAEAKVKAEKDARKTLRDNEEAYARDYPDGFNRGQLAHQTIEQSIDTEITRLRTLLSDPADVNSIVHRREALLLQQQTDIATEITNVLATYARPPTIQGREKIENAVHDRITARFRPRLDLLAEEETQVKSQLQKLDREIRQSMVDARNELAKQRGDIAGSARENQVTMAADFAALTAWGISAADLRTMTVNEIMVAINAANVAVPANGWPAAANLTPANRLRVINAISEAKAVAEERMDGEKPARDISYAAITAAGPGGGFTDEQLRTLSRDELVTMAHLAVPAGAGWPAAADAANIPVLEQAMAEARNRIVLRHGHVTTETIADLDTLIKSEQEAIDKINFESDKDILGCIRDMMGRQGEIFSNAFEVGSNRAKYTKDTAIDPTNVGFNLEKTTTDNGVAIPEGYWELMDSMFAYKVRPDRNEYIPKMIKALPPKELAGMVNEAMTRAGIRGVPVRGAAGFDDMAQALKRLNTGIQRGTMTGQEMRSMYDTIILTLRDKANAI